MAEEPDIVKEMREEEKRGKFYSNRYLEDPSHAPFKELLKNTSDQKYDSSEEEMKKGQTIQVSIEYEQKLLESVEKYEKIFRLCPEAIVLLDKRGNLLDMNERLYDWLGYRPEDVVGKNILDLPFLSKEAKIKVKEKFLLRMLGKDVPPYELEFSAKTGEKRIGLLRATPIKDEYGSITQDLVMVSDITERKYTEQLLHKTLDRLTELEFIVNHSGVVAFLWRAAEGWPVEFVSDNIIQFGYMKDDFLSGRLPYSTFIHEDDLARVSAEVSRYSKEGVRMFNQEYRIRTKSGEIRWIDDRTVVRRNETGKITHYQGIILDITKRKKTEEALQESEERLRRITDNMLDIVSEIDPKGKIVDISPSQQNVFGYTTQELVGRSIFSFLHPDDSPLAFAALNEAKVTNSVRKVVVRFRHVDGFYVWIESVGKPLFNQEGRHVGSLISSRDVTDRKCAEQELEETHQKLHTLNEDLEKKVQQRTIEIEKLLRQKDEFIDQLGHDLKNPLTPIMTLLPLIQKQINDEKIRNLLDVVLHNAIYVKNLVVKTLELAQLNASNIRFTIADVNVLQSAATIIDNQKIKIQQKNITVNNKIKKNIIAQTDDRWFNELFEKLFTNAVKFTPEGGTITIDAKNEKTRVLVSINDTGIGLNEGEMNHIFDEFYKVDHSRHDLESSGLGLAICKRIVEKQGGKIWVESEGSGKGSTFYFTLPTNEE